MRFLLDAQLPVFLCNWLTEQGYQSIHTFFLKEKNQTSDSELTRLAVVEGYVLVTKDMDFHTNFLLTKRPPKLLMITTGNIRNEELKILFAKNIQKIASLFETHNLIELSKDSIIIHQ